MDPHKEIISKLQKYLKTLDYVHAMWLEGSVAQGYGDEYSDIDVWVEVDPDKIDQAYQIIESSLSEIGPIDLRYEVKKPNDQRHIIYHIEGTSDFLTIDANVQPHPWKNNFTKGIDDISILFNKDVVFNYVDSTNQEFNEAASKQRIMNYYKAMLPNVLKNVRRNKPLEAKIYYDNILEMILKYLRRKNKLDVKLDFGYKHTSRDFSKSVVEKLEYFMFVRPDEIETRLDELGAWLKTL